MYKLAFSILLLTAVPPTVNAGWAAGGAAKPIGRGPEVAKPPASGTGRARGGTRPADAVSVNGARKSASKVSTRTDGARLTPGASRGGAARRRRAHAPASVVFPSGTSLLITRGRERVGQEHYDPTGSENPLLETHGANRLKMLSDNFSVGEVARSGRKTFHVARIDPRQVACLQNIRDHVGKPVLIRSGYRSFWHNVEIYRRMGKRPTSSQHISGRASDIEVQGMTGLEVAKAAIDACGPDIAVGIGLGYAHVDVRGYPGVWGYDGVPRQYTAELERYRAARRIAQKGHARKRRRAALSKRT